MENKLINVLALIGIFGGLVIAMMLSQPPYNESGKGIYSTEEFIFSIDTFLSVVILGWTAIAMVIGSNNLVYLLIGIPLFIMFYAFRTFNR